LVWRGGVGGVVQKDGLQLKRAINFANSMLKLNSYF
jgi:hypothetical protein